MDGLAPMFEADAMATCQHTLKSTMSCVGIGLHGGHRVRLSLLPAPADTGIVFHRTDIDRKIPARHDFVADTRLCTRLADPADPEAGIDTVEHVMAALAGCGIDNAMVTVNGPEVPVLDGSAAPFVFLIDCAGREAQDAPRRVIEVLRPVRASVGEAFGELRPGRGGFEVSAAIDFPETAIGRQALTFTLSPSRFRDQLARARTFTLASEITALRAAGLALGGSLDNAVVVDGPRVLNPGGLRAPDEFIRHKVLDIVGDMALAGAPIAGRLVMHRPGHALNNALLHALFADRANWRLTSPVTPQWSSVQAA